MEKHKFVPMFDDPAAPFCGHTGNGVECGYLWNDEIHNVPNDSETTPQTPNPGSNSEPVQPSHKFNVLEPLPTADFWVQPSDSTQLSRWDLVIQVDEQFAKVLVSLSEFEQLVGIGVPVREGWETK